MSGILAVLNVDGRPVDAALIASLLRASLHRGPDQAGSWSRGFVALGHLWLRATSEEDRVRQPLRDPRRDVWLSFDGRVDNRDELAHELEDQLIDRQPSDGEIVLAAYARWGSDCARRILGDFAFAIWDGPGRSLFGARDAFGVRPFYYWATDRTVVCASELRQIARHPGVELVPNDGMAGEYLADVVRSQNETLYRDIWRLPPAHTLVVRDGRLTTTPYWRAEPRPCLRYRTDVAYAEHLRQVFREAVRCRLRSSRPVGLHLSGGLDSSSIVGMATTLAAEGVAPPVETFSTVFPHEAAADERPFITELVRRHGLLWQPFLPKTPCGADYRAQVHRRLDLPDVANDDMAEPLRAGVAARGIRAVLTGAGGDHLFTGSLYHYAELLRDGRLLALARQLRVDVRDPRGGWTPGAALAHGVGPLLPPRLKTLASRIFRGPSPRAYPAWIAPGFARRTGLRDRLWPPRSAGSRALVGRDVAETFSWGTWVWQLEMFERGAAEFGLEDRHPFFDRRLVEFALALPESQRRRGIETKFVLRRAMADTLPPCVRLRQGKADFSHVFMHAIDALGGTHWMDDLAIASIGWVDQAAVSAAYRRSADRFRRGDPAYAEEGCRLWTVASLELWFRCIFLGERTGAVSAAREERAAGQETPALAVR